MMYVRIRCMAWSDELSDEQRRHASDDADRRRLVAGPGTGKTRVLTRRVAYLIEEAHVEPGRVLALTFSRVAAQELRDRLEALVGELSERPTVSTLHAFALRAYPGRGVASTVFQVMSAQARWSRARWFSGFFDQRMRSARKRLSQEWVRSTTQRRARKPASCLSAFASSPRQRMWAVKPNSAARLDEERLRGREVVEDDAHVVHALDRHALDGSAGAGSTTPHPSKRNSDHAGRTRSLRARVPMSRTINRQTCANTSDQPPALTLAMSHSLHGSE